MARGRRSMLTLSRTGPANEVVRLVNARVVEAPTAVKSKVMGI